jgi:hypothetical protein
MRVLDNMAERVTSLNAVVLLRVAHEQQASVMLLGQ